MKLFSIFAAGALLLVSGAAHGAEFRRLNEAFSEAAKRGRTAAVADLLKQGASVRARNRFGSTALLIAATADTADAKAVAADLKSGKLALDAHRGVSANFRPWNNRLHQPTILHTHNATVGRARVDDFLHPVDVFDTLSADAKDSACKF